MADDWQVGDLALYVGPRGHGDNRTHRCAPWVARPTVGRVYDVESVLVGEDWVALGLVSMKSDWRDGQWNARSFIKITPPEADEFDREVIELLRREPVPSMKDRI